jgi:hypothetical protein
MNSLRSFRLDLWSARALRVVVVAVCASLIAACGGGGYGGGGGGGGMGGMSTSAPTITQQPASQSVAAGSMVTFSVTATNPSGYSGMLSYQWMRNATNITGQTAASYTFQAAMTDNGAMFQVKVTNAYGTTTSNTATLMVM